MKYSIIEQAEKDINYVFRNFIKLLKDKKDIINIIMFFNKGCDAIGYVKKGRLNETDFMRTYQEVGRDLKPTITLMMSDRQMTIAHHPTKITSIYVHKDDELLWEGWEEIW